MKIHTVTQSSPRPYCRLPVGRASECSRSPGNILQSETLRYGRVQLCVTICTALTSTSLWLSAVLMGGCSSGPDWTRRAYAFSLPADPASTQAQTNVVALTRVAISPLFQGRSFTYRTAENSYKQDPYAGFLISPERALGEAIRESMRAGGGFGRVVEPGSGLVPSIVAEVFVSELYGDFRKPSQPTGKMELHFLCYEVKEGSPGRVVLDKVYGRETPLKGKAPGDLMEAWDTDLREIMDELKAEYAKVSSAPN